MLITIRVVGVEFVISVLACYLILNFKSCVEKIPFKYCFGHVVGETVPLLRQLS